MIPRRTYLTRTGLLGLAGPALVAGIANARMVDTGLGLGSDGNVYVWGLTYYEMNGDVPTSGWQKSPQMVAGIPEGTARQVTGQIYNANALDKNGTVWGWGSYNFRDGTDAPKPNGNAKQVRINSAWNGAGPVLDEIIKISSTEYAGAGIRSGGTIWHWGSPPGYDGNAAVGASQLIGLPDPSAPGNRPAYLKGAYTNFFLILENGDVYYWGGAPVHSLPSGLPDAGASPRLHVACIATFAVSLFFGVRPLVVISGSMEPTFPVGSVVFSAQVPAGELKEGSIATAGLLVLALFILDPARLADGQTARNGATNGKHS